MRKTITLKYRQTPPDPLELMGVKQQIIPKIEDNSVGALDWYSQNARYVPDDDRIISLEHLQQSRYKLNYRFRWNLFTACLEIDALKRLTLQSILAIDQELRRLILLITIAMKCQMNCNIESGI